MKNKEELETKREKFCDEIGWDGIIFWNEFMCRMED